MQLANQNLQKLKQAQQRLEIYEKTLRSWQQSVNLVGKALMDNLKQEFEQVNFALSLAAPSQAEVWLDMGSGGGIPALIIGALYPELELHMVESRKRKASFLKEAARLMGINATVHNCRLEKLSLASPPDVITARALAKLPITIEYAKLLAGKNTRAMLFQNRKQEDFKSSEAIEWQPLKEGGFICMINSFIQD